MGLASGIAVYVVLWWVVLFAVLPWGVRPAEDLPPGADRGAPERPRLLLKAAVTTLVAAILWLGVYAAVESGMLDFRP
jgi:predicted secreted protein